MPRGTLQRVDMITRTRKAHPNVVTALFYLITVQWPAQSIGDAVDVRIKYLSIDQERTSTPAVKEDSDEVDCFTAHV